MKFNIGNNTEIPALGIGTWQLRGKECIDGVKYALKTGYRHIDTASFYNNQKEIGKAMKQSSVPRDEIFLTSKVWRTELGTSRTKRSFEDTLKELQTDYLDLYLIHWPGTNKQKRLQSYKKMIELREKGHIKQIGVSNFTPGQIEEIYNETGEYPAVNQIHFNPYHYNDENLSFCQQHNIIVTAYTPLNKGRGLNHEKLEQLAEKYDKTSAQILLRWFLDLGIVTIPKAGNKEHIEENFKIFDFQLEDNEVASLKNL